MMKSAIGANDFWNQSYAEKHDLKKLRSFNFTLISNFKF